MIATGIAPRFPHLFTPLQVRSMRIRNRIVHAAITTNLTTKDGYVTDHVKNYYEARAKGGVGLIEVEACYFDPIGTRLDFNLGIFDDSHLPGLRELTSLIHKHGAVCALQLNHGGRESTSEITGKQPVAPSAIPSGYTRVSEKADTPRPLMTWEVKEMVGQFVQAARRTYQAGFDCVAIHAAHGYLVHQFLNPEANKRGDEYGGSPENRARFLCEIIRGIREELGPDYPIMVKINANDYTPDGIKPEEAMTHARLIEEAGADILEVSVGVHASRPYMMVPTMYVPRGVNVPLAEAMKKFLKIPVCTVGRIVDAPMAEEVIASGKADLVALGRAMIADAEWASKVREGRLDDIRYCIACNDGCLERIHSHRGMTCTVNPAVGTSYEMRLPPAPRPKRVVVVGGGIAGLEAARVAHLRGHRVTLFERSHRLGGQMLLSFISPSRDELKGCTDFLDKTVRKLGIDLRVGTEATAEHVLELSPDVVILATGAVPKRPELKGIQRPQVVMYEDVLYGRVNVGQKCVVVGGGYVGAEVAEYLAEQGRQVMMCVKYGEVGKDEERTNRIQLLEKLEELKVDVLYWSPVIEITESGVRAARKGWPIEIHGVDTVVICVGAVSDRGLASELEGKVPRIYTIGDIISPRRALDAIHEGFKVGLEI